MATRILIAVLISLATSQVVADERGSPANAEAAPADSELLTSILDTWTQRQDSLKSARCKWTEHRVYARGSVISPDMAEFHGLKGEAALHGLPLEESVVDVPQEIAVANEMMRCSTKALSFVDPKKIGLEDLTSSFDGRESRIMFESSVGKREVSGSICDEMHNSEVASLLLKPLMMHLRPLDPDFAQFDQAKLSILDPSKPLMEGTCVVIGNDRQHAWVDTRNGGIVRRSVSYLRNGTPYHQVDISYERDPKHGWLPKRWTSQQFDRSGEVTITTDATVIKWEIGIPFKQEDFLLVFPPGATVHNQKQKGIPEYRVQPDGSLKPVERRIEDPAL